MSVLTSESGAEGRDLLVVRDLRLGVGEGEGSFEPVVGAALRADRGEVVGVVGESGSGKSLMLRAIAGLLPPGVDYRGGEVTVGGIDVPHAKPADLHRLRGETVGMIFQEPMTALNPTMRIGTQIAEAARAHRDLGRGEAKARAIDLLGRMGFTEPARQYRLYPHELSGGMRQRVVIAIALAGEPALLLCDEPTTALDATVTMRVLDLIVGLVSDLDIGVVLVTHDLGVAARICDRIVVMYAGRMLEEGPADKVLRRPRHPYTLALLRAVPTRETTIEELRAIPGTPPVPQEQLPGCPFAPRCEFAEDACLREVRTVAIEDGRTTACRRHEVLAKMVEGAGV
ncbi:MAG: ABC transporter ATP-binding protein [Actinobacteria bacterium]|nr:ABC transporter ATP-binding protein [Actinomycetota bacterium]